MNTIPITQNEATQLDRLAAQRRLYSKAKRVLSWQLTLSVPSVIVWSFAMLAWPVLRPYAALWGIVVTLLDLSVLDRYQESLKEKAAKIQELFDCDVLELEWSKLKTGQRPDAELIAEQSSLYRRTDPEYKALRDWYAPAVGKLPIHLARLVCQRASCWWDAKLRRRYAISVLIVLGVFSVLIITLSLQQRATLENFILVGITPLMPAIALAIRQFYEHNDAAAGAVKLKEYTENIWGEALKNRISSEELATRSRQFQDELFEHRRRSSLIFDWIYQFLRDKHENLMNKGAEAQVKEALESHGVAPALRRTSDKDSLMPTNIPQPNLSTIGFPAPLDFAAAPYEAIHRRVSTKKDSRPDPWTHCAGAWNAVGYRFISCAQHDEAFTASVSAHGNSPAQPHRFNQEKELFGFFVTGLAALESFCYGAYAFAAMARPQDFDLAQLWMIDPKRTEAQFSIAFPTEALTNALTALIADPDFQRWKDIRNVLAHRVAPGRQFFAGGPQDSLALWQNGIAINATTTSSRRSWLGGTLRGLLEAADVFTAKHL